MVNVTIYIAYMDSMGFFLLVNTAILQILSVQTAFLASPPSTATPSANSFSFRFSAATRLPLPLGRKPGRPAALNRSRSGLLILGSTNFDFDRSSLQNHPQVDGRWKFQQQIFRTSEDLWKTHVLWDHNIHIWNTGWWSQPLWKIWVCQLGLLFPIQYMEKNTCSKPPTSYVYTIKNPS